MRIDLSSGFTGPVASVEPDSERANGALWKEQQARRTPPPPGTYSAAAAQPPGLPMAGAPLRPNGQLARREERPRDSLRNGAREPGRADSATAARASCGEDESALASLLTGQGGQGQGGKEGEGEGASAEAAAAEKASSAATASAELDHLAGELAALAAPGSDDGLFELLLPGDQTLAVLVSSSPAGVRFMLTPGSAELKAQLNGKRMELERRLEQRIGRTTRLTVL